jgi:hypothetical protein
MQSEAMRLVRARLLARQMRGILWALDLQFIETAVAYRCITPEQAAPPDAPPEQPPPEIEHDFRRDYALRDVRRIAARIVSSPEEWTHELSAASVMLGGLEEYLTRREIAGPLVLAVCEVSDLEEKTAISFLEAAFDWRNEDDE